MEPDKIQSFCIKMYTWALLQAEQKSLNEASYRKYIDSQLKKSKIPYSSIKKIVSVPKSQWIEDLLQITKDVRLTLQTAHQYRQKLFNRAKMHFTNGHKQNLSQSKHKTQALKSVIEMYEKDQPKDWSQHKATQFCDKILSHTVYLVGLVKANGVIVQNDFVVTCAHALMDDQEKLMNFRCFATGNGAYGIVKVLKDNICTKTDVGMAQIIKFYSPKDKCNSKGQSPPLSLKIPQSLKFKTQFSPIRCLQLGLLFNNDPQDQFIKVFEPAEGFIERNLYSDDKDHRLIDDMGLLVHDCYGLWGTSGSPLWSADGELIGIHNAWNQNGYNISMIVHDDDATDVRVVKQYERRVISVHVLLGLFNKWFRDKLKDFDLMNQKQPQFKFQSGQSAKKKVKLD